MGGFDKEDCNPVNWRLYHLLELERPVTAKQVQWTLRKVTLRHHYHQAYLVLSNSDRKSLYDLLGEDVLGFIYSGNWGPLITLLGAKGSIGLYCGLMLLGSLLLLLFFAFLGAQVDDVITWPWLQVVTPLFVFVIFAVIVTFAAAMISICSKAAREEGMRWVDRIPALGNFIASVCYFVFCFAIANEIRHDATNYSGNFLSYFCLPIIADSVYYLSSLVWRWPRRIRLQMEVDLNRPSFILCYGFFFLGICYIAVSIAQWVLIGKKIDDTIQMSWYQVFIPFCFRAGLRVVEACMRSMMKRTIGVKTAMGVTFDTLGSFFTNGALLVSLYFVAVRIERGKEECLLARALIPVYIVLTYILLVLIFTTAYLATRNTDNERAERLNNLKWTPEDPPSVARSAGFLFDEPNKPTGWDAVDDASSSVVFPNQMESDDYDDFESGAEDPFHAPYGVTAPPDDGDARRVSSASRTPSATSETPSEAMSEVTERPRRHRDPMEPRTDAARAAFTPPPSPSDETDEYEEDYSDYEEGEDDAEMETQLSSSATSSAVFTSSIGTQGR